MVEWPHAFLLTGRDKASKWIMARQLAAFFELFKPTKRGLWALVSSMISMKKSMKRDLKLLVKIAAGFTKMNIPKPGMYSPTRAARAAKSP
jgi:hypothetical protein